jgi:hypothetical protein
VAWLIACIDGIYIWFQAGSDRRLLEPWGHGLGLMVGFILAILPWFRWLPSRFSLYTLLISMTLIAVGLGLAAYAFRKY